MTRRVKILIGAGVLLGACTALYFLNPADHALMPKCPIKLLTGYSCPGCGLQRALHAALHGHFREAARLNLFLIPALPYLAALLASDVLLRGERQRRWQRVTHSPRLIYGYLALFLAWWLLRNLLGL
ncbi:MAG: DUF2752 domain-containing protein [Alloprevotella sp.]|nr:DUF2752 domain-containing protein [Alloprevotella sp.]